MSREVRGKRATRWQHNRDGGGRERLRPDKSNRVSLDQVIRTFNWPISEEQAWAVIYQTVRTLRILLDDPTRHQNLVLVTKTCHILINPDGSVADDTFQSRRGQWDRESMSSEDKALTELGATIYTALDQGLSEDQERGLTPELESVLDQMTCMSSTDDDEGIDVPVSGGCAVVADACRQRLAVGHEADAHFQAVCRALVSEAHELSTFMDKVSAREAQIDEELNDLALQDWARLWVSVLKDLRTGAKLKNINYTKTPVEFELTPYEMLMEDIRARKYTLNKVPDPTSADVLPPNVKRDAHDVILEFIRSRPPLKPASERQLKPKKKDSTPVELLMDSIRGSTARTSLRKTEGPELKSLRARLGYGDGDEGSSRKPVDLGDLDLANLDIDYETEDEADDISRSNSQVFERVGRKAAVRMKSREAVELAEKVPDVVHDGVDDDDDEDDDQEDDEIERSLRYRAYKNQITNEKVPHKVIFTRQFSSTSTASTAARTGSPSPATTTASSSASTSRASSRASSVRQMNPPPQPQSYQLNQRQMHATLHSEFIQSDRWAEALQTLDLTLDEVIHIRSVLTKAEMEGLPLDGTLKDDVERGKICFLCMKTRFGFWSGYGHKCQLCKQKVCHKCSTKMSIPLEQFSTTPVFTLEPPGNRETTRKNAESQKVRKSQSFRSRMPSFLGGSARTASTNSFNSSAPSSPGPLSRQNSHMTSSLETFRNLDDDEDEYAGTVVASASSVTNLAAFGAGVMSTRARKPAETEMMNICVDCKEMVLQVIRAQSTARRLQLAKSLFVTDQ